MKTPREIILGRHRAAETKLDAIGQDQLAALARESANAKEVIGFSARIRLVYEGFWRECILPWRRVWAGIAAVWIAILALHLASGESRRSAGNEIAILALHLASGESRQSAGNEIALTKNPQVLSALREQKQMLAQLLEPVAVSAPAAQKNSGPRSEQRHELFIV